MFSRRELLGSIFNKKNLVKTIDHFFPGENSGAAILNDIPELSGELLCYEAERLGLDPSTLPADKLKMMIMAEMSKACKE